MRPNCHQLPGQEHSSHLCAHHLYHHLVHQRSDYLNHSLHPNSHHHRDHLHPICCCPNQLGQRSIQRPGSFWICPSPIRQCSSPKRFCSSSFRQRSSSIWQCPGLIWQLSIFCPGSQRLCSIGFRLLCPGSIWHFFCCRCQQRPGSIWNLQLLPTRLQPIAQRQQAKHDHCSYLRCNYRSQRYRNWQLPGWHHCSSGSCRPKRPASLLELLPVSWL